VKSNAGRARGSPPTARPVRGGACGGRVRLRLKENLLEVRRWLQPSLGQSSQQPAQ